MVVLLLCSAGCLTAQEPGVDETFYAGVQHFKLRTTAGASQLIQFDSAALYLFIFLSPECPLSQNYSIVLNDLQKKFNKQVRLYGIIPGRAYSEQTVREFVDDYKVQFPVLIDLRKELSNYVQATVTPEVVLLNKRGALIYRGAIDDWVKALGQKKVKARVHYLEDAIKSYLQNSNVTVKKTSPVGCLINEF